MIVATFSREKLRELNIKNLIYPYRSGSPLRKAGTSNRKRQQRGADGELDGLLVI